MDGFIDSFETEVVSGAVGGAGLDSAAGKDGGESPAVVIATVLEFYEATDFDNGSAAELSANDDKGFTE